MTDHANELRRYSRKIGQPAGDVPSVMLAAADEIERLAAKLEAAEKSLSCCQAEREEAAALFLSVKTRLAEERDECNRRRLEAADHFAAQTALMKKKYDDLRVKVAEMEKQEPVAEIVSFGGPDLKEVAWKKGKMPALGSKLYALPGAQAQPAPIFPESVMEVIAGLVYEVERNICPHEETHRGGQWEICDMCGARWADDRGGKPEFKWPEVVERARAMLAAAPEAKL